MEAQSKNKGSLLASLRALNPHQAASLAEARMIAEAQADWLLQRYRITGPPVTEQFIDDLGSIVVEHDPDLPVSGSAHWTGAKWIIVLSGRDKPGRQRLVLCHLLKRIIDHGADLGEPGIEVHRGAAGQPDEQHT